MKKMTLKIIFVLLCVTLHARVLAATDRFILVPDANGTTGSIVITTAQGTKVIKKPYTLVKVDELGNFIIIKSNVLCIDKEFDDALGVLPKEKEYTLNFNFDNPELDLLAQSVMNDILAHINATPVPFVSLTGDAKLIAYVQKLLMNAKVPGLMILLNPVTSTENSTQSGKVVVSVK